MAGRGAAAANVTEMNASSNMPVTFVKLEFGSANGTQYVHDSLNAITWDSQSWSGLGDLGRISRLEEGEEVSPYEAVLELSGVDDSIMVDEAVSQQYMDDPITIYLGWLNPTTHALVADPDLMWSGKMGQMAMVVGEVNVIQLTCESDLIVMEKTNGALFSDSNLQSNYSGDTFFKFATQMKNLELTWGGSTLNLGGGGSRLGPGGNFGGGPGNQRPNSHRG